MSKTYCLLVVGVGVYRPSHPSHPFILLLSHCMSHCHAASFPRTASFLFTSPFTTPPPPSANPSSPHLPQYEKWFSTPCLQLYIDACMCTLHRLYSWQCSLYILLYLTKQTNIAVYCMSRSKNIKQAQTETQNVVFIESYHMPTTHVCLQGSSTYAKYGRHLDSPVYTFYNFQNSTITGRLQWA